MTIYFEWDADKAESNLRKHGVSFELAQRVFTDPHVVMKQDRVEDGEMRWQTIGKVEGSLLLLVAHTLWEEDEFGEEVEIIRIISARSVTRNERHRYERQDDE
jgi:uncharacterized protein